MKLALLSIHNNHATVEIFELNDPKETWTIKGENWDAKTTIKAQAEIEQRHGQIPVVVDPRNWRGR